MALAGLGSIFSSALPAIGGIVGSVLPGFIGSQNQTQNQSGTQRQYKDLSPEAMQKLVSDILGSEQGLAATAQGQSAAGLYGSSTNALLTQKLVTDTAGMLANLTAPTVTETSQRTEQKSRKKSIICTSLMHAGLLDKELFRAGEAHFQTLHPRVVEGYLYWGTPLAVSIRKNPQSATAKFWLAVAKARYLHITGRKKNLLGASTVWLVQPACYLLSFLIRKGSRNVLPC